MITAIEARAISREVVKDEIEEIFSEIYKTAHSGDYDMSHKMKDINLMDKAIIILKGAGFMVTIRNSIDAQYLTIKW